MMNRILFRLNFLLFLLINGVYALAQGGPPPPPPIDPNSGDIGGITVPIDIYIPVLFLLACGIISLYYLKISKLKKV